MPAFALALQLAALTQATAQPSHPPPTLRHDSAAAPAPREVRWYAAMTTLHLEDVGGGLSNDRLMAVSVGRTYLATYVNSYGTRSWSAGIQGEFRQWGTPRARLLLGYRAGVLTGYDERFLAVAGRVPVLPLLQPRLAAERRHAGVELSYSGVVASLAGYLRLRGVR